MSNSSNYTILIWHQRWKLFLLFVQKCVFVSPLQKNIRKEIFFSQLTEIINTVQNGKWKYWLKTTTQIWNIHSMTAKKLNLPILLNFQRQTFFHFFILLLLVFFCNANTLSLMMPNVGCIWDRFTYKLKADLKNSVYLKQVE